MAKDKNQVKEVEGEIILFEASTALAMFSASELELKKMEDACAKVIPDLTTAKGITAEKSFIASTRKYKKPIIDVHASAKKSAKEFCDKLDTRKRELIGRVDAAIKIRTAPLEEMEAERQKIQDKIESLSEYLNLPRDTTIEEFEAELEFLESFDIDDSFGEFVSDATIAKQEALDAVQTLLEDAEKRLAVEVELARLQEENARLASQEREREVAEQAAAKAKLDAENAAKAKITELEDQAKEAERQKKADKEEAEEAVAQYARDIVASNERAEQAEKKARIAAEAELEAEREAEAKEKRLREKDKEYKRAINKEILEDLLEIDIDEDLARVVIEAIIKGQVRHVTVNY
jgi:colicin import membrane protein